MNRKVTLKYIFIQAIYWGVVCVVMGYAVTFMKDLGYSNSYIGVTMAIANLASAFTQPILANIADINPKWTVTGVNIVLSVLMLVLSAILVVYKNATLLLTLILIILTVVVSTMQPFLNSLAVKYEESGRAVNYGVCRAAGSLFYAIVSAILGELLVFLPGKIIPISAVLLCLLLLVSAVINKVGIPDSVSQEPSEKSENSDATPLPEFLKKNKRFVIYIIGVSLIFYMHMVLTTYSIQIVENVGGDTSSMGFSLAISAALELPAMIGFNFLIKKFKVQTLLKISAISFSVKALAMAVATTPTMIYLAQFFQISAFALYIPSSVYYVAHLFKNSDLNKGQSLTTMATAIGPVFSNLFTGYLIDRFSVSTTLWISLGISVIGTVIMIVTVEDFKHDDFDKKTLSKCG